MDTAVARRSHELRFQSLFHEGRSLIGRDFASPAVLPTLPARADTLH